MKSLTVTKKKWANRSQYNVIVIFDQAQIQEFRRAFDLMDQNNDGFFDEKDLHDTLVYIGALIIYNRVDISRHINIIILLYYFVNGVIQLYYINMLCLQVETPLTIVCRKF